MWKEDLTEFLEHLNKVENDERINKEKKDQLLVKKFDF